MDVLKERTFRNEQATVNCCDENGGCIREGNKIGKCFKTLLKYGYFVEGFRKFYFNNTEWTGSIFVVKISQNTNLLSTNIKSKSIYPLMAAMVLNWLTISISGFFNDCCIFPFTYNGVSYNECINPVHTTAGPPTTAGPTGRLDPLGGLWCATEINDDGSMKEWKNCDESCSGSIY